MSEKKVLSQLEVIQHNHLQSKLQTQVLKRRCDLKAEILSFEKEFYQHKNFRRKK